MSYEIEGYAEAKYEIAELLASEYMITALHNGLDPTAPATQANIGRLQSPSRDGKVPAHMYAPRDIASVRKEVWQAARLYAECMHQPNSLTSPVHFRRLNELAVRYPISTAEAWHWALVWDSPVEHWMLIPPPYSLLPWVRTTAVFPLLPESLYALLAARYHTDAGDVVESATGRVLEPSQQIRLKQRTISARQAYISLTQDRAHVQRTRAHSTARTLKASRRHYAPAVIETLKRCYRPDHKSQSVVNIRTGREVPRSSPIRVNGVTMGGTQAYLQLCPDTPSPSECTPRATVQALRMSMLKEPPPVAGAKEDMLQYQLLLALRDPPQNNGNAAALADPLFKGLSALQERDSSPAQSHIVQTKCITEAAIRCKNQRKALWMQWHALARR